MSFVSCTDFRCKLIKNERKTNKRFAGKLCVFASEGNSMSCSLFLLSAGDELNMWEKATSPPRKCADKIVFPLHTWSSDHFHSIVLRKENNRQQSLKCCVLKDTISQSHSTRSSLSEEGRPVRKFSYKKVKLCVESSQFWNNMTFQSAEGRQREKDQSRERMLSAALGRITTITVCFSKPSKNKKG